MATVPWTVLALSLMLMGCPPQRADAPGDHGGPLEGIDSSSLTGREQQIWRSNLDQILAPCPDVAVPIAQCITEHRPCAACLPAARFLLLQVRAGRSQSEILDLYDARFDPSRVRTIVVGDSPSEGPANAPVTIVEFADFQCPHCAVMSGVLREIHRQYPKTVRLVFKHYPIDYHPNAYLAACAAAAAQRQGKFWPAMERFFDHQDSLSETELRQHATELGLDVERFERDLNSQAVRDQVDREKRQGKGLGIRGTPTLFINGRELPREAFEDPQRSLDEWIDLELELRANQPRRPAEPEAAP